MLCLLVLFVGVSSQIESKKYVDVFTNFDIDETLKSFAQTNRDRRHLNVTSEVGSKIQKIPRISGKVYDFYKASPPRFLTKNYHGNPIAQNKWDSDVEEPQALAHLHLRVNNSRMPLKEDKKRFLNIFTILQFRNSMCQASGTTGTYEGVCYHSSECQSMGGTIMGRCAKGYGVCCIFQYGCGGSSSQNNSYFECGNPNMLNGTAVTTSTMLPPTGVPPTPTTNPMIDPRLNITAAFGIRPPSSRQYPGGSIPCTLSIYKTNPNVTQLRIDFIDFELRGTTNGNCPEEQFIVTGQNTNDMIPIICGYNTGQHIYIDVSNSTGPIQLSVNSIYQEPRRCRMRVTQIQSTCQNSMNCLQYYTGTTGVVQSFNYEMATIMSKTTPGYLNNLNYAICIQKQPGYCSVTYSNVMNGQEYIFQLINNDENGVNILPPDQAGAGIFNCPDDYIVVNGIRLCGEKLNDGSINEDFTMNAPVTDISAGPIVLPVMTDAAVNGRGFKLFYRQNRCQTTRRR